MSDGKFWGVARQNLFAQLHLLLHLVDAAHAQFDLVDRAQDWAVRRYSSDFAMEVTDESA